MSKPKTIPYSNFGANINLLSRRTLILSRAVGFARFKEFEVNDEFNERQVESLMDKWKSPMWDWECKLCVHASVCFI
ncbi:MAG: hypothetical protein QW158_07545 [Nitrososphaerales archaeon]